MPKCLSQNVRKQKASKIVKNAALPANVLILGEVLFARLEWRDISQAANSLTSQDFIFLEGGGYKF